VVISKKIVKNRPAIKPVMLKVLQLKDLRVGQQAESCIGLHKRTQQRTLYRIVYLIY